MPHLVRLQTACLILGCLALPEWSAAQSITYGQAVYGAVVYSQSVPGSPAITDVAVGDSEATVTFTPPTDTGGGVITGYTITATAGGVSVVFTCTNSPCVLTGLSNGTTYSLTITANNAVGASTVTAAADTATPAATGVETPIPVMPLYALITMMLMLLLGALRRLSHTQ